MSHARHFSWYFLVLVNGPEGFRSFHRFSFHKIFRFRLEFSMFLERSSWFLADLEYFLLHLEQFHKRWQLVFPGTIPSSFAGLPELPDQYALELHREALNAGHTRNDLSPLLERVPQRNPLFFRADFPKCFPPFCKNVPPESFTYRFARVHRSPPGPLCKGCPTASRELVPCRVSRPGS